ncbi:MAG: ABC transporter ATP-binding protein, partial [bacterium]
RAIVREPKAFLMDEPLSNLDAKLRNQMRAELVKLRRRLDTTFIYVTHDQTEAMTLGDRIVIMDGGVVQQVGTPAEVYSHPANLFVAGFIGTPQMNFLPAQLVEKEGRYAAILGGTALELTEQQSALLREKKMTARKVTLGIRPEHLVLSEAGLAVKADVCELTGSSMVLHALLGEQEIVAAIPSLSEDFATPPPGTPLHLTPEKGRLHLFDPETGESLLLEK